MPQGLLERCDFAVERSQDLSSADFYTKYVSQGLPVLIRNVSGTWRASSRWANYSAVAQAFCSLLLIAFKNEARLAIDPHTHTHTRRS